MASLCRQKSENRKVSSELLRQEVSQPWAGGTANSNPCHHRQAGTAREPGTRARVSSLRAEHISRAGTEGETDSSSPATAQRREGFIHPEDCLLTSLPSPCSPNHQATSPSPPSPAQAHPGLLCSPAQEQLKESSRTAQLWVGLQVPSGIRNLNPGLSHTHLGTFCWK